MEAFVSFSSREDREANFIRLLMARLAEHGVTPWIYESVSGAIPVGKDINDYCRRKIDDAKLVIIVVSESTTCPTSLYTHTEVEYIVSSITKGKIVLPLKITGKDWQRLPEPYQKLAGFKGHLIPHFTALTSEEHVTAMETFMQGLCLELQLDYCPPLDQLLRLPIQSNLNRELLTLQEIKGKDWATDTIARIRRSTLDLAGFIERKQFEDAQQEVSYILRLWMRELSAENCQYARVLKYIVAIQQLVSQQSSLNLQELDLRRQFSLEDIYSELKQSLENPESSLHPDGNVHGLLGIITYKLGEFSSAREHYQKALNCIHESGGEDVLARSNILLCAMAEVSNGVPRTSDFCRKLDEQSQSALEMINRGQFVSNTPGEQGRFYLVCLLSLLGCGNVNGFYKYFSPTRLASGDISDLLPVFIDYYFESSNIALELQSAKAILQLLNCIIGEFASTHVLDSVYCLLLERRCRLLLLIADHQADREFLHLALTDANLLNESVSNYDPYQFMEAQIRIYCGDTEGAKALLNQIKCKSETRPQDSLSNNADDSFDYKSLATWLLDAPVMQRYDQHYQEFKDLKNMLSA